MLQERQDRQGAMLCSTYRSNIRSGGRLKGLVESTSSRKSWSKWEGFALIASKKLGWACPPGPQVPPDLKKYYREFLARTNALEKPPAEVGFKMHEISGYANHKVQVFYEGHKIWNNLPLDLNFT